MEGEGGGGLWLTNLGGSVDHRLRGVCGPQTLGGWSREAQGTPWDCRLLDCFLILILQVTVCVCVCVCDKRREEIKLEGETEDVHENEGTKVAKVRST